MKPCIAVQQGVVFVAQGLWDGRVDLFDLDGRRLEGGFSFSALDPGPAGVEGLAVDGDRRVWIADPKGFAVRGFSVFGQEVLRLGPADRDVPKTEREADRAGVLGRPAAVAAAGHAEELVLVVGSRGRRRHGVQVFGPGGVLVRSLRPRGDSHGVFHGVAAVAIAGRRVYAAERHVPRVQVFEGLAHWQDHVLDDPNVAGVVDVDAFDDGRLALCSRGREGGGLWLVEHGGRTRLLVPPGHREGSVLEPTGVAFARETSGSEPLLAVIDSDGERIQLFDLEGRCFGRFDSSA